MSWIEVLGRLSLFLFASAVVALLVLDATRAAGQRGLPRVRATASDRVDCFLWEYVGNRDLAPADGGPAARVDRRRERDARVLVERIVDELKRRAVSPAEREAFLRELREEIRSEARLQATGSLPHEAERRYLETRRWALAERFHAMVEDPPPEIVALIKSGLHGVEAAARAGPDVDE